MQEHPDVESDPDERSRTVARVLAVLEELSVAAGPVANHELAARLGVPRASMHRLLQKLAVLGYVEYTASARYGVAPGLADLAERLADAGCRAPPLRRLLAALRAESGDNVAVWLRSGVNVRIAALLVGRVRGTALNAPGEIAAPFSTPGLAIASQSSREEVRALIAQCRRRRVALGLRFRGVSDVEKTLVHVRARGFVASYNVKAEGWGMLAWPIPVTASPLRIGALTIGAPVAVLRRDEARLVNVVRRLIAGYLHEQNAFARAMEADRPASLPQVIRGRAGRPLR